VESSKLKAESSKQTGGRRFWGRGFLRPPAGGEEAGRG